MFIALAEETGCIEALGAGRSTRPCRQHAAWLARGARQRRRSCMHVNISGKDLSQPHFVPHVREVLARHGLPPRLLVLEITESTLMERPRLALNALRELRELGVKLGIDDFGTGYSSLAYLKRLPVDCLKIDRSFVDGMDEEPQNLEIVRTVISLGRSLNKQVVAEGIETHEQLVRCASSARRSARATCCRARSGRCRPGSSSASRTSPRPDGAATMAACPPRSRCSRARRRSCRWPSACGRARSTRSSASSTCSAPAGRCASRSRPASCTR